MDNVVSKYHNIVLDKANCKKIARLAILRASLFGLKRLKRDEFSLKIILYHLVCYVNVIYNVLVGEFGEI